MNEPPIQVLLVDDDEEDFLITRDLFREIEGGHYQLDWVSDYGSALRAITARKHDVCLIDYRLGVHTGLELLREAQQAGCNAPMILLTGQGDRVVDMEAMRAGAADFMVKGQINAQFLERAIRYAIERKRAEKEIEKLAAFARLNPNPVLEFAADGSLAYSNEAAETLARSVGQARSLDIVPPDVRAIIAECLGTGQNRLQVQVVFDRRTFAWSFFPVQTRKVVHCYAIEITDRLNLLHAQKMEAVGQLAAGVAHDFNNILTIIQGHASLLQRDVSPNTAAAKSAREVCVAAERAGNLIRQLLMFSRKQVIQLRVLDVHQVIDDLAQMLQRTLGEHVVLQVAHMTGHLPVYADRGMLEQMLMNLAVNARDAMLHGGQLTILAEQVRVSPMAAQQNPEARPGDFVRLSVSDTGHGIAPEVLPRIFEPFYTTKEVGKGTGLGLASAYGIVKQHNGWIEVQSQLGSGTTFAIFLPLSAAPPDPVASKSALPPSQNNSERLLVVEDEPALRELVVEILQLHGYDVLSAESGLRALEVWEQHKDRIDLLVTDMVMPGGIMGRELASRLQRESPELKVIYTSGYSPGMAGRDLALLESGNFLPKPYPPTRLLQLVRECLDGKRGGTAALPRPKAVEQLVLAH
ncbi:MAG: response regulator [Verrucomicrobia bacterium]|nr:response regulator [Verrucomicrobiota bacterium]